MSKYLYGGDPGMGDFTCTTYNQTSMTVSGSATLMGAYNTYNTFIESGVSSQEEPSQKTNTFLQT